MEITLNNLEELKKITNNIYMSDEQEENTRYIAMMLYDVLRLYVIDTDYKLVAIKKVSEILFNKKNHTDIDIGKVDDLLWVNDLQWPMED